MREKQHRSAASAEDVVGFAFCVGYHVKTPPEECIGPMMDVAKRMSKPHAPHPPAQSTQHGRGGHVLRHAAIIKAARLDEGKRFDNISAIGQLDDNAPPDPYAIHATGMLGGYM